MKYQWKLAVTMKKKILNDWQDDIEQKIFKFIAYKSRTKKEVDNKLSYYLGKIDDLSPIEKKDLEISILKKIKRLKLVDDVEYANLYVREKINSPKAVSKMQVKKFLLKKGLDEKVINLSLEKYSRDVELEKAKKDAEKKLKVYKNKDSRLLKSKLNQYLSRKGYSYEVIRSVVDTVTGVK